MAGQKLVEIAKRGRAALARWRKTYPDALLNLSDSDLQDVDLRGANLKRADLTGADLRGADLVGAQLAEADLTRADLRDARLTKADLYSARLFKATLAGADCSGTYLRCADLTQVDLSRADLTKASLVEANLCKASLNETTLIGSDLSCASLGDADLRGAVLGWTTLGAVDLSHVIGLDQVVHVGPSTIGFDTATLSHSSLTRTFLQGCGVSEGVLMHWDSLWGHPAESLACMIRYAPDDASFAVHLAQKAQERGVRCWLDEMPAARTDRKSRTSPTRYETTERVLVCCSKAALTSWWFNDEVDRIATREQNLKADTGRDCRLFFPLNLDGYMFSGDWKHPQEKQIARQVIDFVGWRRNQDKLDQELSKLLQLVSGERRR